MLAEDLRKLPEKELADKTTEIRERLFNLSFKSATEPVQNPAEVGELRKDMARIQAILAERKAKGAAPKKNLKLSRAERTIRNARAARLKAEAAKKAANAPKPKAAKQGGKAAKPHGNKSQMTAKKA